MSNLEKRYIEIRSDNVEEGIIKGTAIVFNSESVDLGGFTEIIKPESITDEFLRNQDIVLLYNHNEDSGVIARSKNGAGSLKFFIDNTGVHFECKAKKKDIGIVESIADGDLDACSFAFRIAEGGDKWEKRNDGTYLRTISKFETIKDFSIVVFPAYQETSTSIRSFEEFREKELLEEQKKITEQKEIDDYYSSLITKYNI